MTAYGAEPGAPAGPEHPEEPQLVEIPADMRAPTHAAPTVASPEPSLEVAPSAAQATPRTPPVIPPISEPFPSSEPRIVIPIIKNIEVYATLSKHWPLLRASSLSISQLLVLIRRRSSPLRPSTLPS